MKMVSGDIIKEMKNVAALERDLRDEIKEVRVTRTVRGGGGFTPPNDTVITARCEYITSRYLALAIASAKGFKLVSSESLCRDGWHGQGYDVDIYR